jgi:phosphoribosylformimino-5-aminoimidazole carboxamide ribotide isomerase
MTNTPRVIPVIDLMDRTVVRGVGGRRSEYRAIESRLTDDPSPRAVAAALVAAFGFDEVYLADLDAIAGASPDWSSYAAVRKAGLRLLLDAGVGAATRATELVSPAAPVALDGIVVGLESVASPDDLTAIANAIGNTRGIFSLDLRSGRLLNDAVAWQDWQPLAIAARAFQCGFSKLIVLDLADVGEGSGTSTLDLCRQIRHELPDIELIGGGGVRGEADLARLGQAGCQAALVASALHDGRLARRST